REHLTDRGVLGTSVLWFEQDTRGNPRPPEEWRSDCLATVGTHDLPPVLSYLSSEHVELQDRMGLLGRPVEKERADTEARVERWRAFLVELDLLDPDVDPLTDPVAATEALQSFLAGTPARLVGVALTDVVRARRMQNRPGSGTGYPNWR